MEVFEAPTEVHKTIYYDENKIKLFLAGGITGCDDWQSEVIEELKWKGLDDLIVFNPRRKNFDVNDKNAARKQIEWEFKYLNNMDIFTMYFSNSNTSVQPICLYELGRHLERMKHRFPSDWKDRILIGIEDGYSRTQDVLIQTQLATDNYGFIVTHVTPDLYAQYIVQTYKKLYLNRSYYLQ